MNAKNITDINRNLRGALHNHTHVLIGAVTATDEKRIFVAPLANETPAGMVVKIDKVYLTEETGVAANDTNYWTFQLTTKTPTAVNLVATAPTTKSTGGTAMTANTPWVITPDQNQVLLPGCVIELVATKAASAANLDELSATVLWHWEEA